MSLMSWKLIVQRKVSAARGDFINCFLFADLGFEALPHTLNDIAHAALFCAERRLITIIEEVWMAAQGHWRLFNVDSLVEELGEAPVDGETLDLFVGALAYRNFDFAAKRFPFLRESVTRDVTTWRKLVQAAPSRYWIRGKQEAVLVFAQTAHCGCIRTYRWGAEQHLSIIEMEGFDWITIPSEDILYGGLDTPATNSVYHAWHDWMARTNQEPTELAEGRFENTSVSHSLILSGVGTCLACSEAAVGSARTTIGLGCESGVLVQVPLCRTHMEVARAHPSVMRFLETLFSMSLNLPDLVQTEAIPDELISLLHALVAEELGGSVGEATKRRRGWVLLIHLPGGWHWLLRLNTLMDYAYMLFKPGVSKEVYRADSAPDHRDLPFFPDHEHSKPDRKGDVTAPSFLYGNPLIDLKRLRNVEAALRSK
ncbi:hypothetical protein ALQ62_05509 [Pseudomonas coronafaciens pv. zizaniae]|nr:hypothetical protein ALQ62_05509 [Pseudomonas coronafaciens pv. zizaniae]